MYLPLILSAFSLIEKLIPMIAKWREASQQSGEWTPEEEAQFQQRLEEVTSQDHWKVE